MAKKNIAIWTDDMNTEWRRELYAVLPLLVLSLLTLVPLVPLVPLWVHTVLQVLVSVLLRILVPVQLWIQLWILAVWELMLVPVCIWIFYKYIIFILY
jgi:hypothetical protein